MRNAQEKANRINKSKQQLVFSIKFTEVGMMNVFDPMHPGEFIREMYMEPFDIHAADLAGYLDVSPSTLSRVLNAKADLSVDMAFRLSKVLGRSPESWMNLQTQYNLAKTRRESADKFESLHALPV